MAARSASLERTRSRNLLAGKKRASELREASRGAELAQHRQEVRVLVFRFGTGGSGGGGDAKGVVLVVALVVFVLVVLVELLVELLVLVLMLMMVVVVILKKVVVVVVVVVVVKMMVVVHSSRLDSQGAVFLITLFWRQPV